MTKNKSSTHPDEELAKASPFDLSLFEISEEEEDLARAEGAQITVGRPGKQRFFRCHPDFRMSAFVLTIEDGIDRKAFLLTKPIAQTLKPGEYQQRELRLLTTNFGELILYPLGLASDVGNKWTASAREAVARAQSEWVRMAADRTMGQYFARAAEDQALMGEPKWPDDISKETIIEKAFGADSIITSLDHYAMQKLAGLSL